MMTPQRKIEDCARGQMIGQRRFAGFALTKTQFAPECVSPEHVHACARFVYVLRGALTDSLGDSVFEARQGMMLWRPAGTWHASVAHERGTTLLSVDLEGSWLTRAHPSAALLGSCAEFRGGMLAHFGAMLAHEFHHADEVTGVATEGILLGVVTEASRRLASTEEHRAPEWLVRARRIIETHFGERLTLEEIAAQCDVHPVHLARAYRRHFHSTVGEHIRRLRIEYACREMARGSAPLSAIALAAGFSDQSHFTRSFRQHTGLTPAEYRTVLAR